MLLLVKNELSIKAISTQALSDLIGKNSLETERNLHELMELNLRTNQVNLSQKNVNGSKSDGRCIQQTAAETNIREAVNAAWQ